MMILLVKTSDSACSSPLKVMVKQLKLKSWFTFSFFFLFCMDHSTCCMFGDDCKGLFKYLLYTY